MYMLKTVGDNTPPCGTPFLNWRCFDVLFLNVVYALRHLMFAMYLIMVCGMFVWCSLCVSVSNAFLMSSATMIVHSGGLFWLKPVAMVLFMLCSAVLVEGLPLKPCCVEMFVMYGISVFSSVFLSLREVSWVCLMCLCSCLCLVLELE